MEQDMWIDEWIAAESDPRAVMKDRAIGAGLIARAPSTAPTRRIRRAQSSVPAGLAALDLREARALLRYKDLALRAVAQAGDDAMLAADALRMERDAAHEECARLTEIVESKHWAAYEVARGLHLGDPAMIWHADGSVSIQWVSDLEDAAIVAREVLESIVSYLNTLTDERDRARAIAVALKQGAAAARDEVVARAEAAHSRPHGQRPGPGGDRVTRRLLSAASALVAGAAATTVLRALAWWDDQTMRGEL